MELPSRNPTPRTAGFTLVELLIVVVLLGILSAIALPSAISDRAEAVKSTLRANVQNVGMVLEFRRQETDDGTWPASLQGSWFSSGNLPGHPDLMAGVPLIETVSTAGVTHPSSKIITPACPGAYWYDTSNGAFRARVRPLASDAETLAFYNAVNGSSAASLAATIDQRPVAPSGSTGGTGDSGGEAPAEETTPLTTTTTAPTPTAGRGR